MVMRNVLLTFILMFSLLLSACSLDEDVASLYRQEQPLQADILIPESFSENQQETIEVLLTQNGTNVTEPDFVHFEIWKQDGDVHYPMVEAELVGEGAYSITKSFEEDGLYFVKVHASSKGSIIIPQKQFIVGELSASDLEFLQKGAKVEQKVEDHHH